MKQLFAVALVAAFAAVAPARAGRPAQGAALQAGIERCAAIEDALNRLECYDRLARQLKPAAPAATMHPAAAVPPPERSTAAAPASEAPPARSVATATASAPPPPGGKWERRIERNDKGVITKVVLQLPAASEKGEIGADPITLVLRCVTGETSVSIDWENYVGDNDVPVTLHVDGGAATSKPWQVSVGGSRTRYPGNAVELIRGWQGARELHARISPYGGYPMDATFELRGLAGALDPLRATCHW